ncbi:MAG: hypothetical protein FGF53_08365 [Candidatus Brockarchaeota archaeon]|nr:hypothetical protein [Candidatus Brockarchaeota archaeon]
MAEIPVIIPLLLAGVLFGSILRATNARITGRLTFLGSLLSGFGNFLYTFVLNMVQKYSSENRAANMHTAFNPSFSIITLLYAFLTGFLIVLIIFISAALTLKIRGRTVLEE